MSDVIHSRLIPDPSMSTAEYLFQRSKHPNKPNIGKVLVRENATTRIGGLAHIRRRLPHHERAAEMFRASYEALYGSGTPAIDPANEPVQTSVRAHDAGMAARLDREKRLHDARIALGKERFDIIVASVVLCVPVKDMATGTSGRAQQKATTALLLALDALSALWGLRTKEQRAA